MSSEVDFLVNVLVENGYDERTLRKLAKEMENKIHASHETATATEGNNDGDTMPTITLPWTQGLSLKLRKAYL